MQILRREYKYILVLGFTVILLYFGVTKTFYQQDEWHGMADILTQGAYSSLIDVGSFLELILGRGRVVGNILVYFFYSYFPFQVSPIALFAISLHMFNSVLIFLISKRLTKSGLISFLGALFFVVNGVSHGSMTWPASGITALPASSLIFLALYVFIKYVDNRNTKQIFVIFVLLYTSLFLKETAMPFFVFFPISLLIFERSKVIDFLKKYWYFFGFTILAVIIRLTRYKNISSDQDLFLTGSSNSYFATLFSRAFMYPLTSFSLMFFPPKLAFELAKRFTWVYYPFFPPELYDLVAQTTVLDVFALFFTVILFFGFFVLFWKSNNENKKWVLFFIAFILSSFLPYVIISKSFAYLESRYYYISVFAGGVLLSLAILRIKETARENVYRIFILLFSLFIFLHFRSVKLEINRQIDMGQERLQILYAIKQTKPKLDNQTIFYVTGDRNFYVTEGNPLPLQQGTGHTLLVWYLANNKAPKELLGLLDKQYFWGIGEEGYYEVRGKGFGYYWNKEELYKSIENNNIDMNDVVGLYYDSEEKVLNEIEI